MEDENLKGLEKYAYWWKVNKVLMGPSLYASSAVILAYSGMTLLFAFDPESTRPYLLFYQVGLPIFVISLWLAFSGLLLRDAK